MKPQSRHIAALPTLVTLGNAFCGFLAATYLLEAASQAGLARSALSAGLEDSPHRDLFLAYLVKAVWSMFAAMVFDFLDGKVARLTRSESAFGVQIDSLSDVVSFGLVPALMFKTLGEFEFGLRPKTALVLGCFHLFGAILRLARFNVEAEPETDDHRCFKGLPTPAAAAGVAVLVYLYASAASGDDGTELVAPALVQQWVAAAFPFIIVGLGVLMWTRLPYLHAANLLLTERRQPSHLLAILATIGVVAWDPPIAMAVLMLGYALSGPILYVWDLFTGHATVEGESWL